MKDLLLKRFNSIPLAILFLALGFLLFTPAIAGGDEADGDGSAFQVGESLNREEDIAQTAYGEKWDEGVELYYEPEPQEPGYVQGEQELAYAGAQARSGEWEYETTD